MEGTIAFVEEIVQNIDGIIQTELDARSADPKYLRLGNWKEDETLKTILTDLRSQSQILSQSSIKFSLLINPKVDFHSTVMKSILDEIQEQSQTLQNIFQHLMGCSIGRALFDEILSKLKGLFQQILEMLKYASQRDKNSLNYTTGMVTKVVEEIQKIPLANKAAYRRFFMQKIVTIKETKDEFEGYLQEARDNPAPSSSLSEATKNKANMGDEDEEEDDEEEDDDNDDEERNYSVEEIAIVEQCVKLFNEIINFLKFTLKYFTEIADKVQSSGSAEQQQRLQQWIAQIETQSQSIENQVIDLGAELYPPVVSNDPRLIEFFQHLPQAILSLLNLLQDTVAFLPSPSSSSNEQQELDRFQTKFHSLSLNY